MKRWQQLKKQRMKENVHLYSSIVKLTTGALHEFGIGGNKATKLFTKAEKRKNKDKICLRKKLVDAVKYLLPHTPATVACMRLEDVYRFDGRKAGCLCDIGRDLKRSPTLSKYFEKYPQE